MLLLCVKFKTPAMVSIIFHVTGSSIILKLQRLVIDETDKLVL